MLVYTGWNYPEGGKGPYPGNAKVNHTFNPDATVSVKLASPCQPHRTCVETEKASQ